jgi:hypothetical protein
MPKCKGIPTYTQTSVAFPHNPKVRRIVDEIGIVFQAKGGGGASGEVYFRWLDIGDKFPHGALRIEVFTDGLAAFYDDRIQAVVKRLRRLGDITPARLIGLLETEGVKPSVYQLQGLRDAHPPHAELMKIQDEMAKLRKHERGD